MLLLLQAAAPRLRQISEHAATGSKLTLIFDETESSEELAGIRPDSHSHWVQADSDKQPTCRNITGVPRRQIEKLSEKKAEAGRASSIPSRSRCC